MIKVSSHSRSNKGKSNSRVRSHLKLKGGMSPLMYSAQQTGQLKKNPLLSTNMSTQGAFGFKKGSKLKAKAKKVQRAALKK